MTVVKARRLPKPKPRKRLWNVEASGGGRNVNAEVVAYTLEGAIEAVRAQYPDVVLHKVMCGRWISDVIIAKEKAPHG